VKHIIFSCWKDALVIVQAALSRNQISWLSRTGKKNDDSVQRFNQDSSVTAFLLDGERQNSGLDITSASVCHLLEPVINSGFEMQGRSRCPALVGFPSHARKCSYRKSGPNRTDERNDRILVSPLSIGQGHGLIKLSVTLRRIQ
jgi:hypothetical protein